MNLKNYSCKCGSKDFFVRPYQNQKGLYCKECGKWFKWLGHDEMNLIWLAEREERDRKEQEEKEAQNNNEIDYYKNLKNNLSEYLTYLDNEIQDIKTDPEDKNFNNILSLAYRTCKMNLSNILDGKRWNGQAANS